MIIELTKYNLYEIENSFLSEEEVKNELANNPFAKYLIYKEQGKIVGYLYYSDIYDRVEINQFEIETLHRNCGKGKKLLQGLIKSVDKNITLEVKKTNYPAIHLYKSQGFVEKAIRQGYYKGEDGILMERENEKN